MSRIALLPAGPDPFLVAYWLRHYETWAAEVDELRIAVCGQNDPAIRAYLAGLAGPNVTMSFGPRTDHGAMLGRMIRDAEGLVLLCEDDAFVRRPEAVREAFDRIERGETDIVGCPRASGTPELIAAANDRFGAPRAEATGEGGPLLWPCFLFARTSDLGKTDGHYGSTRWTGAEEALGVRFTSEQAADTFGWASLQLRSAGLRVHLEAQYRAQLPFLATWTGAPWFHVGSLSAGYGQYLLSDFAEADYRSAWNAIRGDLYDWQKRMSWWQRVWRCWDGALPEHHAAYGAAIDDFYAGTGMSRDDVAAWTAGFDALVTWRET